MKNHLYPNISIISTIIKETATEKKNIYKKYAKYTRKYYILYIKLIYICLCE